MKKKYIFKVLYSKLPIVADLKKNLTEFSQHAFPTAYQIS